jgi:hypothetical protein
VYAPVDKLVKGGTMANKTCKFVTILMVMLLVLGLGLTACKAQAPAETVTPPAPPAEEVQPPAEEVQPPAEEVQPPAEEAQPPAAVTTSYPAATYTNDTYGFSIQYPKDWVERPELMIVPNYLAAFGIAAFVPGVTCSVFDNPGPETKDWILQSFKDLKSTDPKIKSDIKEETLAGGKAYTYKANYISSTGYDVLAYVLDVDRDGKRIRINVFTIDAFAPYDETLFSEVAHTLTFK